MPAIIKALSSHQINYDFVKAVEDLESPLHLWLAAFDLSDGPKDVGRSIWLNGKKYKQWLHILSIFQDMGMFMHLNRSILTLAIHSTNQQYWIQAVQGDRALQPESSPRQIGVKDLIVSDIVHPVNWAHLFSVHHSVTVRGPTNVLANQSLDFLADVKLTAWKPILNIVGDRNMDRNSLPLCLLRLVSVQRLRHLKGLKPFAVINLHLPIGKSAIDLLHLAWDKLAEECKGCAVLHVLANGQQQYKDVFTELNFFNSAGDSSSLADMPPAPQGVQIGSLELPPHHISDDTAKPYCDAEAMLDQLKARPSWRQLIDEVSKDKAIHQVLTEVFNAPSPAHHDEKLALLENLVAKDSHDSAKPYEVSIKHDNEGFDLFKVTRTPRYATRARELLARSTAPPHSNVGKFWTKLDQARADCDSDHDVISSDHGGNPNSDGFEESTSRDTTASSGQTEIREPDKTNSSHITLCSEDRGSGRPITECGPK